MTSKNEAKSPRILLGLVLVLTATIALFWSQNRLIDQDESFVLQTDSVSSVGSLIDVQRHYPISLDPLFYHLLAHESIELFGPTAFAIRLPSILGYLLMQCCLFAVAKRIAGARAGVLAASIPVITATTLFFAQHGRPYGVLLGLGALLLLAYQHSTRDTNRTGWLIALALSLALALNAHYFAVLLLLPLYAAELARTAQRRSIDWPVIFAIVLGSAGALLTLPFQKGAREFGKHYYNVGKINVDHVFTRRYTTLTIHYSGHTLLTYAIMVALVLVTIAFVAAVLRSIRLHGPVVPVAEKTFLVVLSTLPLFGLLLAWFVTHSIEVRYV
ncbi:MAG: glycosyltransferase family 39 protein [Terriglobus sp.]